MSWHRKICRQPVSKLKILNFMLQSWLNWRMDITGLSLLLRKFDILYLGVTIFTIQRYVISFLLRCEIVHWLHLRGATVNKNSSKGLRPGDANAPRKGVSG
ncbi:MAG: hypothetical protein COB09_00165 [Thalassobium sp.]|nr:MAG: hypothetical protein COB09_00165 [Thalassobium sp.]